MTQDELYTLGTEWLRSRAEMRFLLVPSSNGSDIGTSIARVLEIPESDVILLSQQTCFGIREFRWASGLGTLLEYWELKHEVGVDAYMIKSAPQFEQYETMLSLLCTPHWKLMAMPEELALCNWLLDGSLQIDHLPEPRWANRLSDEQLKADFTQLLEFLEDRIFERAIQTTIEERISAGWK